MKTLIFKDSSEESHLNQQINVGLTIVNDVLVQYQRTTLKPITDKQTLQSFFNDPVKFVSDQVQQSANLGAFKVNPSKLIDLIDDSEITSLLRIAKTAVGNPVNFAIQYSKLTKKGIEIDQAAWNSFVDKQVCRYAETTQQVKAYETVQRLITVLNDLHSIGGKLEHLIQIPLGQQLLKYNGESNPITINLHGFNQLAQ